MRILFVEDDPLIAMSACDTLTADGQTIVGPFASAASAVAGAQDAGIDVAFLDINIQGPHDGIWLARELKRRYGIESVFMSAESASANRNSDAALGHLCKPYSERALSQAMPVIRALLAGDTPPPPGLPFGFQVFHAA